MVSGYLLPANPSVLATSPLYFDNKWFRQIKSETNKYASSNFTADTMREIYLSFTMIQHMSLVKKPEITVFFSTAALLFCSRPNVIKLECNRFQQILRYLHVNDNWTYMYVPSGQSDYVSLHKIRPVFDEPLECNSSAYYPDFELIIDKAMCLYRGSLGLH